RVVRRKGTTSFIGIDAAVDIQYKSVNDDSTVCHFCPNECKRTFIDTTCPDGSTARYISGFSCEKGTVESEEAMLALVKERKEIAVFSDPTSEGMWVEGGKYGSVDPCFPSKVAQAHIHNLLFKHHEEKALHFIFFPILMNVPNFLENTMDGTSCPIVAGAPNV